MSESDNCQNKNLDQIKSCKTFEEMKEKNFYQAQYLLGSLRVDLLLEAIQRDYLNISMAFDLLDETKDLLLKRYNDSLRKK